jgi:hypothetical protein
MLVDKSSHDETVWQAWLKKNKAQDRFRYERRFKIAALLMVFVVVSAMLWGFIVAR